MGIWDIIGGSLLIIICVAIAIMVLMQESPKGGAMSALTGSESYYNKNQGRTLDALLAKGTKYFGIALFVIALVVYGIDIYIK